MLSVTVNLHAYSILILVRSNVLMASYSNVFRLIRLRLP